MTFTVPEGERHTYAQFEAVTGYMPPEFSRFWRYDGATGRLVPLDDGPGEQASPVVLATPNGDPGCGQCGAKLVAARTPCQRAAGCGARQRRSPTGGAA